MRIKNVNNKEVGARISKIRRESGLTMKEFGMKLADYLGMDKPINDGVVSKWESGVNLPNNERLKVIAELGGISVAELMSESKFKGLHDYTNQELLDELSRRLGT